jgi:ribosomal-protein-alanine N-acetyltransferase
LSGALAWPRGGAQTDCVEVTVETLSASDAEEFIEAVRTSRDLHHPWIAPPDTPERFAAYLEHASREDQAVYLIRHAECGALAGYVSIGNIVRRAFQSAYLGYGAFRGHDRRGLMSAGLTTVINLAFSEVGLHRLEANIQPANAASLALVRRLGFQREGFSPRYLMVDGDWRDHERWAIRSETWAPDLHAEVLGDQSYPS